MEGRTNKRNKLAIESVNKIFRSNLLFSKRTQYLLLYLNRKKIREYILIPFQIKLKIKQLSLMEVKKILFTQTDFSERMDTFNYRLAKL